MKIFAYISTLFLSICLGLTACQSKPTKTDANPGGAEHGFLPPPTWTGSMLSLKKSLTSLEPYLFNKKHFNDSKNHDFLAKEIHSLAIESKNVRHDPTILSKDPTVRFVSAQFADELQRADENFSTGWKEFSRSQLVRVTSYCIECHTRLKQGPEYSADEKTKSYVSQLPIRDQAEFMVAFRQYDSAFKLIVDYFKSIKSAKAVSSDVDQIARIGLQISAQYNQDKNKVQQLVSVIESNTFLPNYLKISNKSWKASLKQWSDDEAIRSLSDVKMLLKNRKSEVDDMRVIAALLNILTDDLSDDDLAEALLLTGESYEALNKISIMSLHQNYYESCVRRVPHTATAKICFNKFKSSVFSDYTGSSGTHVPKDIQQSIQQLKKQME